jgi:quinol monooxygenase YgiN
MEATVQVNNSDSINIQNSIYDDEIIFSIWRSGAHVATYLKQDDLKRLVAELSRFIEVEA